MDLCNIKRISYVIIESVIWYEKKIRHDIIKIGRNKNEDIEKNSKLGGLYEKNSDCNQ